MREVGNMDNSSSVSESSGKDPLMRMRVYQIARAPVPDADPLLTSEIAQNRLDRLERDAAHAAGDYPTRTRPPNAWVYAVILDRSPRDP